MKKSIFTKIFSGYVLVIGLLAVLILFFSFRTIHSHYIDSLRVRLINTAVPLKRHLEPLIADRRIEDLQKQVRDIGERINTRITVVDSDGHVLADSKEDPHIMDNHATRPEIIEAFGGDVGTSLRYSRTMKEEMLYVASPLKAEGTGSRVVSVIRVSMFLRDINTLLNKLKTSIFTIVLLVFLASLAGAFIFARSLSTPIRELAEGSQKVARGDFDVRIFLKNRDELRDLAENFNEMTAQIKKLFEDISLQKEELNHIISSIQEGLLVIDGEGMITLANQSFKNVGLEGVASGKHYWEVIRNPSLDRSISRVMKERVNRTDEIEINGRTFLCSAASVPSGEDIIILFHDITEMKNLEKIKRDFVHNVSHELRTPLTAIKGFIETLEEDVGPEQTHYIEIIKRHTERLINIVRDLLILSKLEKAQHDFEPESLDIGKLLSNVCDLFRQKSEGKGLTLSVEAESGLPEIQADVFKLEQVFINLIENAIKYTEDGSVTVGARLSESGKEVEITVSDTGIGIPEEYKERIFERFFVVDKSRSRRMGGTGLGLSIVKHIILQHDGTVKADSTPGRGTEFTITLPVNPM